MSAILSDVPLVVEECVCRCLCVAPSESALQPELLLALAALLLAVALASWALGRVQRIRRRIKPTFAEDLHQWPRT